ncbi:ankyrin repeat and MYND domain-containing protein 1 [Antennarius striatus]|uniref:ankyrin repeat and MYND domain-containing protein 1 n=1 Tax=Antennarius striatus TaxID=241820 RepID=UPI0035B16B6F
MVDSGEPGPAGGGAVSPAGGGAVSPAGGGAVSPAGGGAVSPAGGGAVSPAGGGAVSPAGGGREPPGAEAQRGVRKGAETRHEFGTQEWNDGSRYEGEFMNGLKHGRGKYTWRNGEFYEGSFYKDYKHGDGTYTWPAGHKFTGKFYLDRKEGWGRLEFPDGATFRGLYHTDQRFGPGVIRYPDGCSDVGVWVGERLLKLCTSMEEGFSLKNFPEYAAYMDPAAPASPPTQVNDDHRLQQVPQWDPNRDLLSDDDFILPPGIESYSTDGDHLPLPPNRRRELDQLFYGDLWEPDPYRGYKRDPIAHLPLESRLQAHIHKHRRQVEGVNLEMTAVLALNREGFGPKGPLEVLSELFIQHAARGDLQAVSRMLQTSSVHPDVADAQGHTALIAATVNCHNDVIHRLLDSGADIDKLNSEGMSALAVCHVLYYPFDSLQKTFTEPAAKTQGLRNLSTRGNSSQISRVDVAADSTRLNDRPPTDRSDLSDPTTGEEENVAESWPHLGEHEMSDLQEEREGEEGEEEECNEADVEKGCSRVDEEDVVETGSEELLGVNRCIPVWDGLLTLGSVQWRDGKAHRVQGEDSDPTPEPTFDSTCSVSSYEIRVTDEMMQLSAEALSRTGIPQRAETQETVRRMAAMKVRHRALLSTLKLLLERGAGPDVSKVPMPVLFLPIMAGDVDGVRRLLLSGAHTDVPLPPEKNGLYPLHVAAALLGPAGPRVTELLLHAITDPDARACDQNQIYELDQTQEPLSTSETPHPNDGGRTALHVACQRDGDFENVSKVVALLLSHRANTELLWSGHSPLSLAISTGNDLAVKELLNGGANPNTPLGCRVGNALCAIANINYNCGSNRPKLLKMLAQAGADLKMPVLVGDTVGTAVDFAHRSFNQDTRIANPPFHALSIEERETFKARRQLLSTMGDLQRQIAEQQSQEEDLEEEQEVTGSSKDSLVLIGEEAVSPKTPLQSFESPLKTGKHKKPETKFCYQCGRSYSVKLIPCSRCHKVYYCSTACKLEAWDERHKKECIRLSGGADGPQRSTTYKPRNLTRHSSEISKSRIPSGPPSVTTKSPTVSELSSIAEEILESPEMEENYSYN